MFFPWVLRRSVSFKRRGHSCFIWEGFNRFEILETKATFMETSISSSIFQFLWSMIRSPSVSEPVPRGCGLGKYCWVMFVCLPLDETGGLDGTAAGYFPPARLVKRWYNPSSSGRLRFLSPSSCSRSLHLPVSPVLGAAVCPAISALWWIWGKYLISSPFSFFLLCGRESHEMVKKKKN